MKRGADAPSSGAFSARRPARCHGRLDTPSTSTMRLMPELQRERDNNTLTERDRLLDTFRAARHLRYCAARTKA